MNNAKQLAYALIDALNACGIEEEFSYRFLAEMNDILRKENKELELQNEAHALAGHNKELQESIILLMKEYGLGSGEAYELIHRLSNAGNTEKIKASVSIHEAVQESGTCKEPGNIADVMQDVYTSGEDPGDTHEPSKGSGTRDYETILKQLDWALDTKEVLSHYRLFNEIKEILKEHQVQNARAEYDIDKHTITNGYIETKPLTGVYDKDYPITMPVEPKKDLTETKEHKELMERSINPVNQREYVIPLTSSMYADGPKPKPEIDTTHEGREYQLHAYKDMNITFMYGDTCIESTDIRNALLRTYLLCEGNVCHFSDKWYEIEKVKLKQFPSHEVIVKLKEVKRYE